MLTRELNDFCEKYSFRARCNKTHEQQEACFAVASPPSHEQISFYPRKTRSRLHSLETIHWLFNSE